MRYIRVPLLVALAGFSTSGCDQSLETYAANCSTPLKNWGREKDGIGHLRKVQPIYLAADGSTLWNTEVISDATLQRNIAELSDLNPEPQIVVEIAPAALCHRVETVRAILNASPLCKGPSSLCSEGWNWREWPLAGVL